MRPIQHPSNNGVLGAPAGMPIEECRGLFITRVMHVDTQRAGVFSYWKPDADELALLAAGHAVRLSVLGITHAPVAIGVDGDGLDAPPADLGVDAAMALARDLVAACRAAGLVLTVEQVPLKPLAMGHYRTVCSVRQARGGKAT